MPELLTKHPEVAIQVLEGGGARCGPGQPQKILTQCRPERFCTTSSGELCVFGLDELSSMTQITQAELAARVCNARHENAGACAIEHAAFGDPGVAALLLVATLAAFRGKTRPRRRLHPERSG